MVEIFGAHRVIQVAILGEHVDVVAGEGFRLLASILGSSKLSFIGFLDGSLDLINASTNVSLRLLLVHVYSAHVFKA